MLTKSINRNNRNRQAPEAILKSPLRGFDDLYFAAQCGQMVVPQSGHRPGNGLAVLGNALNGILISFLALHFTQ